MATTGPKSWGPNSRAETWESGVPKAWGRGLRKNPHKCDIALSKVRTVAHTFSRGGRTLKYSAVRRRGAMRLWQKRGDEKRVQVRALRVSSLWGLPGEVHVALMRFSPASTPHQGDSGQDWGLTKREHLCYNKSTVKDKAPARGNAWGGAERRASALSRNIIPEKSPPVKRPNI